MQSNALPQQAESIDFNGIDSIVIEITVLKYLNCTYAHRRFLRSINVKYYIDHIMHLESYELKFFL